MNGDRDGEVTPEGAGGGTGAPEGEGTGFGAGGGGGAACGGYGTRETHARIGKARGQEGTLGNPGIQPFTHGFVIGPVSEVGQPRAISSRYETYIPFTVLSQIFL